MDAPARAETMLAELVESAEAGVPILRATALELARLEHEQERISGNALAAAILRDPLMTLRVLRFLYSHRTRSQTADITTIAHAIMMLGQTRFFREFGALPIVEDALQAYPDALASLRSLMSRARLASLYARDWAIQRHDMDPEEIMVAALLHDVNELLGLLQWPSQRQWTPGVFADLRPRLFASLGLPGLLAELTEDAHVHDSRVLNVRLACELASVCADGWLQPALAQSLEQVQRFLHVSAPEVWERVRRVALQAAREWQYYEVLPAASWLPALAPGG